MPVLTPSTCTNVTLGTSVCTNVPLLIGTAKQDYGEVKVRNATYAVVKSTYRTYGDLLYDNNP